MTPQLIDTFFTDLFWFVVALAFLRAFLGD